MNSILKGIRDERGITLERNKDRIVVRVGSEEVSDRCFRELSDPSIIIKVGLSSLPSPSFVLMFPERGGLSSHLLDREPTANPKIVEQQIIAFTERKNNNANHTKQKHPGTSCNMQNIKVKLFDAATEGLTGWSTDISHFSPSGGTGGFGVVSLEEDCFGAIDGTYVQVEMQKDKQQAYRNLGWKSTGHDSRVLENAIVDPKVKSSFPPHAHDGDGDGSDDSGAELGTSGASLLLSPELSLQHFAFLEL
ncbi:hypothetical protein T459_30301 [Capsicum annuum]|uniref:Uncharacterized protein n=1 Tax=Capsicum annuum TaxID=4072 RepID=A0A2G2Y7X9_CAPAN|nr:hypothetical protein T459_30301 [Capsicum annuum]